MSSVVKTKRSLLSFTSPFSFFTSTAPASVQAVSYSPSNNYWISKSALPAVLKSPNGAGSANAAVSSGGAGATLANKNSYRFNGSMWISAATVITARYTHLAAGTANGGLIAGGSTDLATTATNGTEVFTGSNANSVGSNTNLARREVMGGGTKTSAFLVGGLNSGASATALNSWESYNGTIWSSESSTLNTARAQGASAGVKNSSLVVAGTSEVSLFSSSEKFNGTAWSISGSIPVATKQLAGSGTQNAAMVFGGTVASVSSAAFNYNGSVWSSAAELLTARSSLSGCGSMNSSLSFGGANSVGTAIDTVENYCGECVNTILFSDWDANSPTPMESLSEFTGNFVAEHEIYSFKDSSELADGLTDLGINAAEYVWTSSGNLSSAHFNTFGAGHQSAAIIAGGINTLAAAVAITEKSNKDTWSTTGSLLQARFHHAGAGSPSAMFIYGGSFDSATSSKLSTSEVFNGNTWSYGTSLSSSRSELGGAGTSTAALSVGGTGQGTSLPQTTTEKFNGLSWSSTGALTTARRNPAACGTQSAALAGGTQASPTGSVSVEKFNGSAWATAASMNFLRYSSTAIGKQNNALMAQGLGHNWSSGSSFKCTEVFDGTTWRMTEMCINQINKPGGAGSARTALLAGSTVSEKRIPLYADRTSRSGVLATSADSNWLNLFVTVQSTADVTKQ